MSFDPVTAQQAAAQAKDWRAKRLVNFDAARDIPGCFAWLDASSLPGSNGATIGHVSDGSGNGNGVRQTVAASSPTLNTAALGGLNTLTFSVTQWMTSPSGGLGTVQARPQPITYIALCKLRSAGTATNLRYVACTSGGAAPTTGVGIRALGGVSPSIGENYPFGYAGSGSSIVTGGRSVNDGAWHIIIAKLGTGSEILMVDGWMQAVAATQLHGTNTATGAIVLGGAALAPMALGFDGDIAEVILAGDVTVKQMEHATRYLAAKWSV